VFKNCYQFPLSVTSKFGQLVGIENRNEFEVLVEQIRSQRNNGKENAQKCDEESPPDRLSRELLIRSACRVELFIDSLMSSLLHRVALKNWLVSSFLHALVRLAFTNLRSQARLRNRLCDSIELCH
jgi:hypothetical protein